MSKVAIVAAMEREVGPLVKDWRTSEKTHGGRTFPFFENDNIVLVCGGIGAEAARRAAEAVIAIYEPATIYSVGFAGALDPTMKVGDVVSPERVVNSSDGSSVKLDGGNGVLVTFPAVASPKQKVKLRESFGAQAVDMEAAAVARAADAHGVGFRVVKAISDEIGFDFPSTERFVDSKGKFAEGRFALFVALRPWLWPSVFALAKNSKRASRSLCAYLKNMEDLHNSGAAAVRSKATI
jgi:adenosylhomocysteine nucleosidase